MFGWDLVLLRVTPTGTPAAAHVLIPDGKPITDSRACGGASPPTPWPPGWRRWVILSN